MRIKLSKRIMKTLINAFCTIVHAIELELIIHIFYKSYVLIFGQLHEELIGHILYKISIFLNYKTAKLKIW